MSVLDRKLGRDLWDSRGVLLAIGGIIAAGVACFVAMRSAYHNLGDAKSRYYSRCRMADFELDVKKAPIADLARVAAIPGITEIRPRIRFFVTVDIEGVEAPLNGLVLSLPEEHASPIINDVVIRRGGGFTDRRDEEVLVNEAFAAKHGIKPGDRIGLLLNNRRQDLHVVGTAISSEFVYLVSPGSLIPDPEHFGVFYLKRRYMEEVFDFRGACNQVVGLLAPDVRDRPRAVLDRAERALEPFGVVAAVPRADQVSNRFLSDEIEQLGKFAIMMPVIFLGVAALVLNVLMGRLAEQQRTIIGTLKALGYSHGQILAHFLRFGAAVGLVGGLAGCGLGYLMAGGMTSLYRVFFQLPELNNRVFPGVYAVAIAISLGCALLGVVRGIRSILGLEPAQAMRPRPPERGGAILLERFGPLWERLDTGWRMVLRSVFRNRRRSLVGVIAAALAASIMVCGLVARQAVVELVDFQYRKVLRSDIDLAFRDERGRSALLEARRLPGVDHAEPTFDVGVTFRNGLIEKKAAISGVAPGARLSIPRDADGDPVPIPESGLVLSRALADKLRLGPGDEVVVEPTEGRRDPRRAPVVAISDSYLGLTAHADLRYLSRLMDEAYAVSGVQLVVDPSPRARGELYRELKQLPSISAVNDRAEVIANLMTTMVDTNKATTGILVLFAGVICFGTTLNASLVGLAERRREVATLLVLGYTPRAVGGLFLRESLAINVLGTVLGLPLGYELFESMIHAYQTDLFRIPSVDPTSAFAWTLAIGLVFTLAAHAFVQRSINRMDWLEKLKGYD